MKAYRKEMKYSMAVSAFAIILRLNAILICIFLLEVVYLIKLCNLGTHSTWIVIVVNSIR